MWKKGGLKSMLCGTNMTDIKISNRSAILRLLHEAGAMSRKQIAARLKLTPATITVIINELINEDILVEGSSVPNAGAAGRREVMVEISREKYVALGLALSRGLVKFTVVNLHGEMMHEETFELPQILTSHYFAEEVGKQIQLKLALYGYSEEFIIGMGITVCGIVDFANGIILDSDGIWEEKNVPIVKMFRKQFSFPVIAANNVRSYANAYTFLQRDPWIQNMLFLRNEATMGAALILNGQFYGGDRNLSAGIAHFTVVPNGRKCHCGKRGCLDTVASQNGMMTSLQAHFGKDTTPLLYEKAEGDFSNVTFPMFMEAAYAGDCGAAEVIRNAQEIFAQAITFSIQLLDVQQIVFYGSMFENHQFFDSLRTMLVKNTDESYKQNFYKVVPSDLQLDLKAAPILVVTSFFGEGGHRNY